MVLFDADEAAFSLSGIFVTPFIHFFKISGDAFRLHTGVPFAHVGSVEVSFWLGSDGLSVGNVVCGLGRGSEAGLRLNDCGRLGSSAGGVL